MGYSFCFAMIWVLHFQDENQIRWAEGFIIVYDVANLKSFDSVAPAKDKIEKIKSARNMSFIVIGNKTDLNHCRVVNSERAEKLCNKLTAGHFECSACGANDHEQTIIIWEAFEELCREIQQRRRLNSQSRIRRRSSLSQVKQGLKMLVTPNKSKNSSNGMSSLLSSSAGGGTLGRGSRRGSCASTGKGEGDVRSVENGKHLSPTGCNSPKRSRSPRSDKHLNGFFTSTSIKPWKRFLVIRRQYITFLWAMKQILSRIIQMNNRGVVTLSRCYHFCNLQHTRAVL